jgi:hypothetical protein
MSCMLHAKHTPVCRSMHSDPPVDGNAQTRLLRWTRVVEVGVCCHSSVLPPPFQSPQGRFSMEGEFAHGSNYDLP